jgi:hypothetical protein
MSIRDAVNVRDLKVSRTWDRGLSRKTSEGAPETAETWRTCGTLSARETDKRSVENACGLRTSGTFE